MLQAYGDGKIFGERYGEGPVRIVWLHGWARRGQDFARAAAILAERGISSVTLDLPGFGSSPAPDVQGGARHYAELLVPILQSLGAGDFVIVGHSFGGRIATVLGATHPELVEALVLTGVPLIRLTSTQRPSLAYRSIRWLHGRGVLNEERMERARQKYGSYDYRHASGMIRDVLVITVNESYEDELGRLTKPVSLVWGDDDREVEVDIARRALALMHAPHRITILKGVGHLVPTTAPEELAAAVLEVMD